MLPVDVFNQHNVETLSINVSATSQNMFTDNVFYCGCFFLTTISTLAMLLLFIVRLRPSKNWRKFDCGLAKLKSPVFKVLYISYITVAAHNQGRNCVFLSKHIRGKQMNSAQTPFLDGYTVRHAVSLDKHQHP